MATNSDSIEQESFVYTSATRTTKTTSSSTQRQQLTGRRGRSGSGGNSRYRFRNSSLPRSAESGNSAPSPLSPLAPPWSWFMSADGAILDDAPSQQQQTMSGSTDGVNDCVLTACEGLKGASGLAVNGRQQQHEQPRQQASVVRRNHQQQQAKRVSLSQNDLQREQQQQLARQYHDNNNSSKVKLLIAPATTPTTPQTATKTTLTKRKYYSSSKQPQMVRSATATFATINSSPEQQLRSQSASRQQQQQSRQRNYHHYDYYTDSDLASSLLASQPAANSSNATASFNNYNQNGNHYDENLLLFATEHNTNYNQRTNGNRQQSQVSHLLHGGSNPGGGSNRNLHAVIPTGKFVSSYPSWRQAQSSATGHQQNYSFHVPLSQPPLQLPSQHHHQQQQIYHQSRYGFVAPASNGSGGRFGNSHRLLTIGHLPDMVKVSIEDNSSTPTDGKNRSGSSALATSSKERTQFSGNSNESVIESRVDGSANYENFYEKPAMASMQQHLVMSEGDLLRVHVADYKSAPFPADYGFDNPFKPGTELSWEADMMVRLMKRGYPVKELPVLVRTAKQVAIEIGSPTHSQVDESQRARLRNNCSGGSTGALANQGVETNISNGDKQQVPIRQQQQTLQRQQSKQTAGGASSETINERRLSSLDLRSGKQVWANSLSRAKSMPRFYPLQADADSIDKLITSIENEMSDLLQHDDDGDNRQRLRRRKGSDDKAATYAVDDDVDDSDNGTPGGPSLAINTKVPSGGKTKSKKRAAPQKRQQSEAQQVAVNRKAIAGAPKQQQRLRKGSSGSGDQKKTDLNNQISRKHKRDFECCMIQ